MRKPIGGEFWFTEEIFHKAKENFRDVKGTFLSGGQSALRFILEDLKIKAEDKILLPSHLCPTILDPLKEKKISYDFYEIEKDLSINREFLEKKLHDKSIKVLYIIHYFGFYHQKDTLNFLKEIQRKYSIQIIEDAVQLLWFEWQNDFMGDYVFNSYRKFLPIDGSLVLSKMSADYEAIKDLYYVTMNRARAEKQLYIDYGIGEEADYLALFQRAEEHYHERNQIYGMNAIARKQLEKIDIQSIGEKRKNNYAYLYDNLQSIPFIECIIDKDRMMQSIPLGLPVYILYGLRDHVRKRLRERRIYCPVHWNVQNGIGENILMIPIDQRYYFEDMDYIAEVLKEIARDLYDQGIDNQR